MMGSTLFNVAAITGLSSLGIDILTTMEVSNGKWYHIDTFVLTYSTFTANNLGRANEPISNNEHVAFLFY